MNPELEASIQHWQRLASGDLSEYPDAENCALCHRYAENKDPKCRGCPVAENTGQINCHGTPYYEARRRYRSATCGDSKALEDFKQAAQKEVDFLISLRDNDNDAMPK